MTSDRAAPDISYEELLAQMPTSIKKALPQAQWNIDLLWKLDLPVQEVPVAQLTWMFKLPLWQLDGKRFQVSPEAVLKNPRKYPAHHKRIMQSDLAHPIHIVTHHQKLTVLDGVHRLAKAVLLHQGAISAMHLSEQDLEAVSAT